MPPIATFVVDEITALAPSAQRLRLSSGAAVLVLDCHAELLTVDRGSRVRVAFDDTLEYVCNGHVLRQTAHSLLGSCGGLVVYWEGAEHMRSGRAGDEFVLSASVDTSRCAKRPRARGR